MTEFLGSLKADLLDRRMRPLLALVGVALLAALGYAALGGGSSSTSPTATTSAPPISAGASGIAISQAPSSSNQAIAETTSGSAQQHGGSSRNPFTPLPGAASKSASTAAASSTSAAAGSKTSGSGSSATGSSESGSSSKSSTETSPAATPKPPAPAKPETVYHVAVLFGIVPAGTPPASAQLTPYLNLKRQAPLPSSKQPLVVFRGVTSGGKSATFTLVGEAILRGAAKCLPSASQCQAIELKTGQSEEFEYLPPTGAAVTYELQLSSITSTKATASAARRAFRGESKAGRELLRRIGLVALPGLRYSQAKGVLVLVRHRAFGARAHTALARKRP
ncbi:MAG: hypothetical protein ACHP93_00965 [Solirubrobacterales bacterium]